MTARKSARTSIKSAGSASRKSNSLRRKSPASLTLRALADQIALLFPPHLAEDWDNVGLQIGDPAAQVRRIMTCLEVTEPTLAEARRLKADTIIAHHPLIFRPFKTLLESRPAEKLATELVRAGIGLIVAHTNMDSVPWGTNQVLARACGLTPLGPLAPRPLNDGGGDVAGTLKFVVFTPLGHEQNLIEAIHRGGGGRIGLYTHCTFRAAGTGTFMGGEGSDPFIGKAGEREEATEYRIESVVPRSARGTVLAEILKVHPYEEPAYEFYPLAGGDAPLAGLGCMARPSQDFISLDALIKQIKSGLKLKQLRVSGPGALDPKQKIESVAICSGSGGSFIAKAASRGAQCYITGEISYHGGIEAHQRGLTVIEVGHFESEQIIAAAFAESLASDPVIISGDASVVAAKDDLQPFRQM